MVTTKKDAIAFEKTLSKILTDKVTRSHGRIKELERNMDIALTEIELHEQERLAEQQAHIETMEDRMSWYEKELNLNPLSWGKKKRK